MQDETFPAELDPWDEWLANPNQLAGSSVEALGVTSSDAGEEVSELDFARQLLNRDERSSDNWTIPTAEQLDQIISSLKVMDCQNALNNQPFPHVGGQETPCAVMLASQLANLEWADRTSNVAEHQERSKPQGLSAPTRLENIGSSIESLDSELRSAFLDDATFCMGAIEASAMLLETDADNCEAILQISRQLHTLKGASASVGLSEFADRLHSLEEVIRCDQLKGRVTPADLLLESLDWFRFQLSTFRHQTQPATSALCLTETGAPLTNNGELVDQDNTGNSVASVEPLIIESADDEESVRVKTSQLNRLMDMLSELVMLRNRRQTETNELREIYHELNGSVAKLRLLGSLNAKANTNGGCLLPGGAVDDSHRPLAWADSGSLQLSEIAADVQEMAQRVRECTRPVAEGNEAVSQFIRQFRFELVELCRAPTTGLLQRLQRVVRDAAKAEGKKVRLESIGAAATVERSLQQRLYEPLLHVVRNSVCHGIESAEQRQAVGKSPTGVITLAVESAADLLVIEVRDDGGGLKYQAIRQRAVQQGLLASGHSPTEQELAQLIFHPGFSTRQSANQQAGRGVGMDVVASTLARLGGWIDVESIAGKGATIRLNVPLRSAIEHLMVFRCGHQQYALPLLSIRSAGETGGQAPSVVLAKLFSQNVHSIHGELASLQIDLETSPGRKSIGQVNRVNLLVDEIIGPEEVVVRPLPTLLRSHPFCSGATLSSTGETVLVLDARKLLANLCRHELISMSERGYQVSRHENGQSTTAAVGLGLPVRAAASDALGIQPLILVVDDSVSSRKAVVRSLKRFPLRVMEATDGRQAIQLLKTHRFAAIFSDLEMPHVDGLDLLAEVRSRENSKNTPFIMITSRQESEFSSKAQALGANQYLSKPINDSALDSALSEISSILPFA